MREIFKNIPNYEGFYQVSNLGRIKSLKRKTNNQFCKTDIIMKLETRRDGYKRIMLQKNGIQKRFFVHVLVGLVFIENIYNKPCINHKNGIKANNFALNLEWVTHSENTKHAHRTGLAKVPKGEESPHAKLKNSQVKEIRELGKIKLYKDIAKDYNVSLSVIKSIMQNKHYVNV